MKKKEEPRQNQSRIAIGNGDEIDGQGENNSIYQS
jgi:hypothetical protein